MNFYLSAVDDQLRHPDDSPSIGIILCADRNNVIVEYALRDASKPMGVARYSIASALPLDLQSELPTIEDIPADFPVSLSLFKLRREIEHSLRIIVGDDSSLKTTTSIGSLLTILEERADAPASINLFFDALAVMNQVIHRSDIDQSVIDDAIEVGNQFLSELNQLQ